MEDSDEIHRETADNCETQNSAPPSRITSSVISQSDETVSCLAPIHDAVTERESQKIDLFGSDFSASGVENGELDEESKSDAHDEEKLQIEKNKLNQSELFNDSFEGASSETEDQFTCYEDNGYIIVNSKKTSSLETNTFGVDHKTWNDAEETNTDNSDPENDVSKETMGCTVGKSEKYKSKFNQAKQPLPVRGRSPVKSQNNFHMQEDDIDLPENLTTFIKYLYHMDAVPNEVPFRIEIKQRENGTEFLQIHSQYPFELADHPIFKELSQFSSCQISVGDSDFLHPDRGHRHYRVEEIEQRYTCVIRTHQPSTLLTATSPGGHRVCVCEGSIADSSWQLLVLPHVAGQREWSPQIQEILERECILDDVERYFRAVGPQPRGRPVTIPCRNDNASFVRVIHVPSRIDQKQLYNIQGRLRHVIEEAAQKAYAIALPYDWIGRCGLNQNQFLEVMLQSIAETFCGKAPVASLKLYLDAGNASSSVLCEEIWKFLTPRGWESSGVCGFGRGRSVNMCTGDILEPKAFVADAVVCSSHRLLDLTQGQFSRVLLQAAGEWLSKQCKERYPEGMKDRMVAITDSFQLTSFKKIFHIWLPHWEEEVTYPQLEWLRASVRACLTLASALKFQKIIFPMLGVGTLKYPAEKVAETLFSTFREFFAEMSHSSVKDVTVVCFRDNVPDFQDLKIVQTRFAFQQTPDSVSDIVLKLKEVQIHIIHGSHQQHTDTAEFVVENDEGTYIVRDVKKRLSEDINVYEGDWAKEFKKLFSSLEKKRMVPFCVQINLETSHNCRQLVGALEKCLPAARNLKVLTLVVPTDKKLLEMRAAFTKATEVSKFARHVNDAGSDAKRNGTEKLFICGRLSSVKQVIQEIIPDRSQRQQGTPHMDDAHASPVDGPEYPRKIPADGRRNKHRMMDDKFQIIPDRSQRQQGTPHMDDAHASPVDGPEYPQKIVADGQKRQQRMDDKVQIAEDHKLDQDFSGTRSPPSRRRHGWSKELDVLEHKALQFLLGETFDSNFRSSQVTGDRICIMAKSGSPPDEVIKKMEALRREDLPVDPESCAVTFDTKSEGIEAYIEALPHQGRVAVFCFDYETQAKAKHFVKVKTGQIRTAHRNRGRVGDRRDSRQMVEKAADTQQTRHQLLMSLDLTTITGGIKVSVYKTDITKLPVDAIVNAANEHLSHGGGVANAIARAGGFALQFEGDEYVKKHGPLKVTQVVVTTGGGLPCQKVLHAVGPRWSDYKDKAQCCEDLTHTVFNCLALASENGLTSIAISSISSAIFGVPQEICARCYLAAVQRFDDAHGSRTSLTHVHFVDVNDTMVSVIQNTFKNLWNTKVSLLQLGSQSLSADRDGSSAGREQRRHQYHRPEPTSPDELPALHGPPQGGGDQRMMNFHGKHQLKSRMEQFNIEGIRVLFQHGDIFDTSTDALALWQIQDSFLHDTLSMKFLSIHPDFIPEYGQYHRGEVVIAYSRKTMVLLPVVNRFHSQKPEEIRSSLQKVLWRVNENGRKSVAIPRYPYEAQSSDKQLEMFAVGLHQAVENISTLSPLTVSEVHIFDPEEQNMRALVEWFRKAVEEAKRVELAGEQFMRGTTANCSNCHARLDKDLPVCPTCQAPQGIIRGNQPEGTMTYCNRNKAYIIEYKLPAGNLSGEATFHGERYVGLKEKAYLPDTREGRKVLMLMETAFDRRLLFRVGQYRGQEYRVTWSGIEVNLRNPDGSRGYPDAGYLNRVQQQLAAVGVTEQQLTANQKAFIDSPRRFASF